MKPAYTLDDIEWHTLIQNINKYFDDLTIKRGFQYFKQERVHEFTMPDAGRIRAIVEGNENYHVELNLFSFSKSHCTCPVLNNCKHMIAVLLHYANKLERSIFAIVNAKSTSSSGQASVSLSSKKTEEFTRIVEMASRIPTLEISKWHAMFELCIAPLSNNIKNDLYVKDVLASIYKIKPQLSSVVEQLFQLHAHLFTLEKLVKQSQNQGYNAGFHIGYHTHVASDDVQKTISRIFANELAIKTEPEHWNHVIETLIHLRKQMLTEPQNRKYFSDLYFQLWLNWIRPNLNDTKMFSEELLYLQSAQEELSSTLSQLPWLLAQSRIHFFLSQDQEAWALLKAANDAFKVQSSDVFPILNALFKAEDWARLKDWLVELGPLLARYRDANLNQYVIYWDAAIEHLPDAEDQMLDTLVRMLPFSGKVYEETLLSHGKWQQWMDYQLSAGNEPLEFRVSVLQPLEKQAPEMLLPFYHQAVERYVLQKNRGSYKAAVKLLKRLFKLYKRMKQEGRWEQFLTAFGSRHSRLRALQEELRRGKLLP